MILTTFTQVCDTARRQLAINEQKMLIDILNGTMLNPQILGQHLIAQVEDSFSLYPGIYEEKWGVNREEMLTKIKSLDSLSAALVELWAVGFWDINRDAGDLEAYILGKINVDTRLREIVQNLQRASEMLEKTKTAFKSGTVAEGRNIIEKAVENLGSMI